MEFIEPVTISRACPSNCKKDIQIEIINNIFNALKRPCKHNKETTQYYAHCCDQCMEEIKKEFLNWNI